MAAVAELIAPLVSSTLTTVVVFAPLGLLSGVAGQFFRALSLSLSWRCCSRLACRSRSCRCWRDGRSEHHTARVETQDGRRALRRPLDSMVHHPLVAVAAAILLAVGTVALFMTIGTGFLPQPTRAASSSTT